MSERLREADLREIEDYLASGAAGQDDRVATWLRALLAEVRRLREDAPHKMHGDALLDGSGTRHGEHEVR